MRLPDKHITLGKEFKLTPDELFKSQEQIKLDESFYALLPQKRQREGEDGQEGRSVTWGSDSWGGEGGRGTGGGGLEPDGVEEAAVEETTVVVAAAAAGATTAAAVSLHFMHTMKNKHFQPSAASSFNRQEPLPQKNKPRPPGTALLLPFFNRLLQPSTGHDACLDCIVSRGPSDLQREVGAVSRKGGNQGQVNCQQRTFKLQRELG